MPGFHYSTNFYPKNPKALILSKCFTQFFAFMLLYKFTLKKQKMHGFVNKKLKKILFWATFCPKTPEFFP